MTLPMRPRFFPLPLIPHCTRPGAGLHGVGALLLLARRCMDDPKFLSYPVAAMSGCDKFDCISVG